MASALLTDELFYRYWCRRELDVATDAGFHVVLFNRESRFWSVLEATAIEEFRTGGSHLTGGVDVLVLNRQVNVGVAPADIETNARRQRVIYVRPGFAVRP